MRVGLSSNNFVDRELVRDNTVVARRFNAGEIQAKCSVLRNSIRLGTLGVM